MIYHDYTANTFIHIDSETNVCETFQVEIGENQYLADIQVDRESGDPTNKSIAVKFVLNDGSEYSCGTESTGFTSIVP